MLHRRNNQKQQLGPKPKHTVKKQSSRKFSLKTHPLLNPTAKESSKASPFSSLWAMQVPPAPKRTTSAYNDFSFGIKDHAERAKTSFDPESISPAERRHVDRQRRLLSKLHLEEVREHMNAKTINKHRLIEEEFAKGMAEGTVKLFYTEEQLAMMKKKNVRWQDFDHHRKKKDINADDADPNTTPSTTNDVDGYDNSTIINTLENNVVNDHETNPNGASVEGEDEPIKQKKRNAQSWLFHINGELREYNDLNAWPVAEFPNGNMEPALYGPKHHLKQAFNTPSAAEYRVLSQCEPSYFSSWTQMRPPFRNRSVRFAFPGPGPLSTQEDKDDWKRDLVDVQWFYRLWDPRYVSPDPTTMQREGNYPMIYAFNALPTYGQMNHPDYKKFVKWIFWPEYLPNRANVARNAEWIESTKPLQYLAVMAAHKACDGLYTAFQVLNKIVDELPHALAPGRMPAALRRTGSSVKHELQHFGHGFKRLMQNSWASTKMLIDAARNKGLFRSQRRMIVRTAMDLLRLIPLIIILVIPFLEFALPLLLKLFPNMLPSTFTDKKAAKAKAFTEYKMRLQLSKYLENTLVKTVTRQLQSHSGIIQDIAMDPTLLNRFQNLIKQQHHIQIARRIVAEGIERSPRQIAQAVAAQIVIGDEQESTSADESSSEMEQRPHTDEIDDLSNSLYGHESAPLTVLLNELFERLARGESIESAEVQPLYYFFNKIINFDTLRDQQIEAMARYMGISTSGDGSTIRNNIYRHFNTLRKEDEAIREEGIEKLSIPELQFACGQRGMRYNGVTKRILRSQLDQWLRFALDIQLTPALLILSRSFAMLEEIKTDPRFNRAQAELLTSAKKRTEAATKAESLKALAAQTRQELEEQTVATAAATATAAAVKQALQDASADQHGLSKLKHLLDKQQRVEVPRSNSAVNLIKAKQTYHNENWFANRITSTTSPFAHDDLSTSEAELELQQKVVDAVLDKISPEVIPPTSAPPIVPIDSTLNPTQSTTPNLISSGKVQPTTNQIIDAKAASIANIENATVSSAATNATPSVAKVLSKTTSQEDTTAPISPSQTATTHAPVTPPVATVPKPPHSKPIATSTPTLTPLVKPEAQEMVDQALHAEASLLADLQRAPLGSDSAITPEMLPTEEDLVHLKKIQRFGLHAEPQLESIIAHEQRKADLKADLQSKQGKHKSNEVGILSELDTGSFEDSSSESFEKSEDPLGLKKVTVKPTTEAIPEKDIDQQQPLTDRQRLKMACSEARDRGELVEDSSSSELSDDVSSTDSSSSTMSDESDEDLHGHHTKTPREDGTFSETPPHSDDPQSDGELAAEISRQLELHGSDKLTSQDIKMFKRHKTRQLKTQHGVDTTSEGEDLTQLLSQVTANIRDDEEERREKVEEAAETVHEAIESAQAVLEQKKKALVAASEANKVLSMATAAADAAMAASGAIFLDAALAAGTPSPLATVVPPATLNTSANMLPTQSAGAPSPIVTTMTDALPTPRPQAIGLPKETIAPPPTPKM